jgi:predicted lysophospholipase L1 biosynthesis ABC-type transport system permease subunit
VNNSFSWRTAAKIAWREGRASSGRFLFVAAAVAIGVGSLVGVRGFSQSFRDMLLRDARMLLAADRDQSKGNRGLGRAGHRQIRFGVSEPLSGVTRR